MNNSIVTAIIGAGASLLICIINIIYQIRIRHTDIKRHNEDIKTSEESLNVTIKEENKRLEASIQENIKLNQANLSAQYITDKRIQWIQELRNTMADFRACTIEAINNPEINNAYQINRSASLLKLLLNINGEMDNRIDQMISDVIQKVMYCRRESKGEKEVYYSAMDDLTAEVRRYLKIEWERVKNEIKGVK